MIKVANNIQRMLAKQAAANPIFTNYSNDPLRPALAPVGQLPQSYESEEAGMQDLGDITGTYSVNDRLSTMMDPKQYSMLVNQIVGSQNLGKPTGPEKIYTHGAYGPSRASWRNWSNESQSAFSPYGYGDLYNMSPVQIQSNPKTNMLF